MVGLKAWRRLEVEAWLEMDNRVEYGGIKTPANVKDGEIDGFQVKLVRIRVQCSALAVHKSLGSLRELDSSYYIKAMSSQISSEL